MALNRLMASISVAALLVVVGNNAHAQSYPAKTIKIIIPSGPGGPNDLAARVAADILGKRGQPVIVENRPGAGGLLGAREAANAPADGHTLLVGNTSTLALLPATSADPAYDPLKQFAPVAQFWESYQVLVVSPSNPARTLKDFVNSAKAQPGKLNFAHAGGGGLPHIAGELFKARAGIDLLGVPYRSDAEGMTAVMSEAVQLAIPAIGVALPLVQEGKLRALAVTSPVRTALAPNMPTAIEQGIQAYDVTTFFGIVAPAGTPAPIVRLLNNVLNEGLRSADARSMITRLGGVPRLGSPEDFSAYVASAQHRWRAIVEATPGARVQ